MSLYKILFTFGKIEYSCYIEALNTAEAIKQARAMFAKCDRRVIIQL